MIKIFACILALAVLAHPVYSQNVTRMDVEFDIRGDRTVRQTNTLFFAEPVSGTINYTVGAAAREITVSSGDRVMDYQLANVNGSYELHISVAEPVYELSISYSKGGLVFLSESVEYFFAEFDFENAVENMTAVAKIPEGYVLYQGTYKPAYGRILSDGQRIIILWDQESVKTMFFSARYVRAGYANNAVATGLVILGGAFTVFYVHYVRKRKEDILFGFREDEKRVIAFLRSRKNALQSELEKEFRFSRSKSTRVVAKLVEKGMLVKQKYGRTNKLQWSG